MKTLTIDIKEKELLLEMSDYFFPKYNFGFENDYSNQDMMNYVSKINGIKYWKFIHWFEFCILPKIAQYYTKSIPSMTESYATYIIGQKIINELEDTNPINTLYDIWKHPANYLPQL